MRDRRVLPFVGYMVLSIGMAWSLLALRDQNDQIREVFKVQNQDRKDARVAGCIQENVQTQRNRVAAIGGISVLVSFATPENEEEEARIQDFLSQYREETERLLPYRDCSPEGLEQYYENPPPDPAANQESP